MLQSCDTSCNTVFSYPPLYFTTPGRLKEGDNKGNRQPMTLTMEYCSRESGSACLFVVVKCKKRNNIKCAAKVTVDILIMQIAFKSVFSGFSTAAQVNFNGIIFCFASHFRHTVLKISLTLTYSFSSQCNCKKNLIKIIILKWYLQ